MDVEERMRRRKKMLGEVLFAAADEEEEEFICSIWVLFLFWRGETETAVLLGSCVLSTPSHMCVNFRPQRFQEFQTGTGWDFAKSRDYSGRD